MYLIDVAPLIAGCVGTITRLRNWDALRRGGYGAWGATEDVVGVDCLVRVRVSHHTWAEACGGAVVVNGLRPTAVHIHLLIGAARRHVAARSQGKLWQHVRIAQLNVETIAGVRRRVRFDRLRIVSRRRFDADGTVHAVQRLGSKRWGILSGRWCWIVASTKRRRMRAGGRDARGRRVFHS